MSIQIQQIHPIFVGQITGIDLRKPISRENVRAIQEAVDRYGVLVFPGQPITDNQLADFGLSFGPLHEINSEFQKGRQVIRLSNLGENNRVRPADDRYRALNAANDFWHVDNTFSEPPAKYSVLMALIVPPEGGETEFADARAGYDSLPVAMRNRIENLIASHSFIYSRSLTNVTEWTEEQRAALPSRLRRVIKINANTGRKSLYVTSHVESIVGMPDDEGRALVRELTEYTTQPQFVYQHRWNPGDLIMYDNRAVMHRARPYPSMTHPRDMRAIRIMDDADPDQLVT